MQRDRPDDGDDVLDIGKPIPRIVETEIEPPPEKELVDYVNRRSKDKIINSENQNEHSYKQLIAKIDPINENQKENARHIEKPIGKTTKIIVGKATSQDNIKIFNIFNKKVIMLFLILLLFSWMLVLSIQIYEIDKKLDNINASILKLNDSKINDNDFFIKARPDYVINGNNGLSAKKIHIFNISNNSKQDPTNISMIDRDLSPKSSNPWSHLASEYHEDSYLPAFKNSMEMRRQISEISKIED